MKVRQADIIQLISLEIAAALGEYDDKSRHGGADQDRVEELMADAKQCFTVLRRTRQQLEDLFCGQHRELPEQGQIDPRYVRDLREELLQERLKVQQLEAKLADQAAHRGQGGAAAMLAAAERLADTVGARLVVHEFELEEGRFRVLVGGGCPNGLERYNPGAGLSGSWEAYPAHAAEEDV